jgi:hypothetical protein
MAKSGKKNEDRPAEATEGEPGKSSVDRFMSDLHIAAAGGPTFVGMVKPDPDDKDSVMFAHVGDCSTWTKIHRSALADAKMLHIVPCGDHEHHVARLTMNVPQGSVQEALSGLAVLHKAQMQKAQMAATRPVLPSQMVAAANIAGCPNGTWVDRYGQSHCV